jgi:hypothetical protein
MEPTRREFLQATGACAAAALLPASALASIVTGELPALSTEVISRQDYLREAVMDFARGLANSVANPAGSDVLPSDLLSEPMGREVLRTVWQGQLVRDGVVAEDTPSPETFTVLVPGFEYDVWQQCYTMGKHGKARLLQWMWLLACLYNPGAVFLWQCRHMENGVPWPPLPTPCIERWCTKHPWDKSGWAGTARFPRDLHYRLHTGAGAARLLKGV